MSSAPMSCRLRRTLAVVLLGGMACAGSPRLARLQPGRDCQSTGGRRWEIGEDASRAVVRVALVADGETRAGWDVYGALRLREALLTWNAVGLPFRLEPTDRWLDADIRVVVVTQLPHDSVTSGPLARYRAGFTRLALDVRGTIARAHVAIAERAPDRAAYSVSDQQATLLHELGHALGLPHAAQAMALMASHPRVQSITASDRRLVDEVYRRSCGPRSASVAVR